MTSLLRRFLLLSACLASAGAAHAERLTGSGTLATEPRSVPAFQAVLLKGSIDVQVRQAAVQKVEVKADDNLVPIVETTVVDRGGVPTLEVTTRRGTQFSSRNKLLVVVEVPTLQSLALSGNGDAVVEGIRTPGQFQALISGSGDMRLTQVEAAALVVRISGSGDVVATGRAPSLNVSISGSGDVVTRDLQADDVKVKIAGSGDARVRADKTLEVSIAGSGDVAYAGEASVRSSVAGSGSVRKL